MASTTNCKLVLAVTFMILLHETVLGKAHTIGRNLDERNLYKSVKASVQQMATMAFGCDGVDAGDANITCEHEKLERRFGTGLDCSEKVPVATRVNFVSCPVGYAVVETYKTITCKFPGKWDNDLFTCEEIPTTEPPSTTTLTTTTKKATTTKATIKKIATTTKKPTTITTSTAATSTTTTTPLSTNLTIPTTVASPTSTSASNTTTVATDNTTATIAVITATASAPTTTGNTALTSTTTTTLSTTTPTTASTPQTPTTTTLPTTTTILPGYRNGYGFEHQNKTFKRYIIDTTPNKARQACKDDGANVTTFSTREKRNHLLWLAIGEPHFMVGMSYNVTTKAFENDDGSPMPTFTNVQIRPVSTPTENYCVRYAIVPDSNLLGLVDQGCQYPMRRLVICEKHLYF